MEVKERAMLRSVTFLLVFGASSAAWAIQARDGIDVRKPKEGCT